MPDIPNLRSLKRVTNEFVVKNLGVVIVSSVFALVAREVTARIYGFLATASELRQILAKVALVLTVYAGGYAAYRFKQKNQLVYGISEICFGIVTAGITVFSIGSPSTSFSISLIGGTYVVARGFNNFRDYKTRGRLPAIEKVLSNIPSVLDTCFELNLLLSRTRTVREVVLADSYMNGPEFMKYYEYLKETSARHGLEIRPIQSFFDYYSKFFLTTSLELLQTSKYTKQMLPHAVSTKETFDTLESAIKDLIAGQHLKLAI